MICLKKKRELTPEEIELKIANVKASFAIENMFITDEEAKVLKEFAKGEITEDEALKRIQEV